MELRHLQTLQAILREGSFLGAARALGLAQPTVTLHVQELEAELGLALFDRTGRQRRPTEAGALLAERGLPVLDAMAALRRSLGELRDGACGLLRLGAIEPAASDRVTPLLGRLGRERPGLRIQLVVSGTRGLSRAVAERELDVALCSPPPAEFGLRFEPLFAEELVFLVPAAHPLAAGESLLARQLEGVPLAVTDEGCAYRRALESALGERGVAPCWSFESDSSAAVRAAAAAGLGIAVLPRLAALPPPADVVVRRASDLALALPVGLVTRPGSTPPPPSLAHLVARLRDELARPAQ